jgi:HD-GYP domain-containing protein (c-di-GMP phosphodiesterase class II)
VAPSLRFGELIATLALGQDNCFGQPLESQLRSCLLATWIAEQARLTPEERETTYWVALLRYLGCTGHTQQVAELFGDDIALRARTLIQDAANPQEVMADLLAYAGAGRPPEVRAQIGQMIVAAGRAGAVPHYAEGCAVGDLLLVRLGFGASVRDALAHTFERWNGAGFPRGTRGTEIPLPMRIVHLSHDMEALARQRSPAEAVAAARDRRDRTYDPALAELFVAHGAAWFGRLSALDPWDAVLAAESLPHRTLAGGELDEALQVVADFVDLKSPAMAGHSRACAELAADAARRMGFPDDGIAAVRRAALVHDLGSTAIPNSIWDKPSALTRTERDRVELHPLLTEQMLRRSPALAALIPIAGAHHERADGTGYHKRCDADATDRGALLLAAADVYVGLTTDRADRPALSGADAAVELRRLIAGGTLDARATTAVLGAAGHEAGGPKQRRRTPHPGGLSERELEVLRLAARGLTTAEIAKRLFISSKTADHHIQHAYTKIGVSSRGAAALWAMQHGLMG